MSFKSCLLAGAACLGLLLPAAGFSADDEAKARCEEQAQAEGIAAEEMADYIANCLAASGQAEDSDGQKTAQD